LSDNQNFFVGFEWPRYVPPSGQGCLSYLPPKNELVELLEFIGLIEFIEFIELIGLSYQNLALRLEQSP